MAVSDSTATIVNFQTKDRLPQSRNKKHLINISTLAMISVGYTILHVVETMDITDVAKVVKDLRLSKNMEYYR